MVSQAVDKQIEMIRQPMAFSGKTTFTDKLLILGGQKVQTSRRVRSLTAFLGPFFSEVQELESLLDIDEETIKSQPTILILVELDELLFKDFSLEKFQAIVRLCDHSRNILWVTVGSRGEEPYMNMMVGTGRCLVGEMPSLRLQFLNFDASEKPSAQTIAEHLLRLQISDAWGKGLAKSYEPLWTLEREVSIDNGTMLIPRYLPATDINTRLNSERRFITKDVIPSEAVIEINSSGSSYDLLDCAKTEGTTKETISIQVSKSLLCALSVTGVGCLYLVAGNTKTGKKVVSLSETNRSIWRIWGPQIFRLLARIVLMILRIVLTLALGLLSRHLPGQMGQRARVKLLMRRQQQQKKKQSKLRRRTACKACQNRTKKQRQQQQLSKK